MKVMRKLFLIFPSVFIITGASIAQETLGSVPSEFDQTKGTKHLVVVWNDSTASVEEADEAAVEVERVYGLISDYLGRDRVPGSKIIVILEGAMFAEGQRRIPWVDWEGRVHLFRSPGPTGEYLSIFPHELVHALRAEQPNRKATLAKTGGRFLEEGFAEAVALIAEGGINRYPYWGTEPDVVVWHLMSSKLEVALEALIERHDELSLKCELQSYPLRGSFFRFLEKKVGREKLLELAYRQGPFGIEVYEKAAGTEFAELVDEWRGEIEARSKSIPEILEKGKTWQTMVEGFGLRLCRPGEESSPERGAGQKNTMGLPVLR